MDIGENQLGIFFIRIEHPVAVMHVDIDIGYALNAVVGTQRFNHDAKVIEDAEAGGTVAPSMVQSADGLKCGPTLRAHDVRQTIEGRTNYRGARFIDARKDRRVSVIQILAPIVFRSQDIVGRVGGEEFLVVLPNTTATGGRWVAEALRESIAATRCSSLAGKPIPITVSMGLHEFDPRGDRDCDDLINDADQALYRAKAKGRDRVEVFESVEAAPPVTAAMPPTRREAPADQRSNIR